MRPRIVFLFTLSILLLFVRPVLPQTDPDVASLLETGRALYNENRLSEAETVFQQAVAQQPESAGAHYWLGMTCYTLEDDKTALQQFERVVKLDRNRADGYIGIGLVYLRTDKRRMDARRELETAVRVEPENAQAYYYLGLTYISTNQREQNLAYGAYKDGQKFFRRAIELNPDHPDAYYQLARSYEYPSRECHKAIPFYFLQLKVKPDHRDALTHLGACLFETGRYRDAIDMLTELAEKPGADTHQVESLRMRFIASLTQSERNYAEALESYERYIATLMPDERALYTDLSLVAPDEVAAQYEQAAAQEKAEIWRKFWAARDPDISTEVNERLVEHYRRVLYARTHFSRGIKPWDRRGEIYVRYGEPDNRQRVLGGSLDESTTFPTGKNEVDSIRELNRSPDFGFGLNGSNSFVESWVYAPYKLELFFVDVMRNGKYDYPPDSGSARAYQFHPRKKAELLIERAPEGYRHDYGGDPLDVVFDVVTYKDANNRTLVEVAYSVPIHQLGDASDGRGVTTYFDSHVVLEDGDFRRVAVGNEKAGPVARPLTAETSQESAGSFWTAMVAVSAPAGQYRSALAVRDSASRNVGIFEMPLAVSDYNGDSLKISDIKLSTSIMPAVTPGPYVRHGLNIIPHPIHVYDRSQPVYLYYEVYHLIPDDTGRTRYQTELEVIAREKRRWAGWRLFAGIGRLFAGSQDKSSVFLSFEDAGAAPDAMKYTSVDMSDAPPGAYTLKLKVTDLHTGRTVSKTTEFDMIDASGD